MKDGDVALFLESMHGEIQLGPLSRAGFRPYFLSVSGVAISDRGAFMSLGSGQDIL